jgi:hypothetical protein
MFWTIKGCGGGAGDLLILGMKQSLTDYTQKPHIALPRPHVERFIDQGA